jgi:cytochrome oxidase Cu insertion factor (SCO1/SenC/PrrC family)
MLRRYIQSTGRPALGGPWTLVDHNGVPKTDASYRGEFQLLYFGFTYCPDICPSELVKVGKIMSLAGNAFNLGRLMHVVLIGFLQKREIFVQRSSQFLYR